MTEEQRRHVVTRASQGSAHALDEAAQVLEDALGRQAFLEVLRVEVGHPSPTPAMEQRLTWLRAIPFRSILTTNFDGVVAGELPSHEAYRSALRPDESRWWAPRYWSGGEGAFTLKLHGDVSRSAPGTDDLVLTRRDYRRRLYEDAAYETFLRSIMATTTVLYMGFSFEDAYLNELRSEVLALLGQRPKSSPVAYAIVNDVPPWTQHHFRSHEGIEILSYDTRGGSDFSGFDACLRAIHDATNPLLRFARHLEHQRILWVDPHPENNEFAFRHLEEAARLASASAPPLVTVSTADEGLEALGQEHFDLTITHWGEGLATDASGSLLPAAVRLLSGMREQDLRCPTIVFASAANADARKRQALALGAQAYCFRFETLYQTIDSILASGEETG